MTPSLETRDLTIRFGGHVAVDAVSCAFRPGELTAIVGPNGAGKTTYFNLISGPVARHRRAQCSSTAATSPRSARRSAPGRPRPRVPAHQSVPQPQRAENVRLAVQAAAGVALRTDRGRGCGARDLIDRADEVLTASALGAKRNVAAAALSHGDQRKLEVAMMMALEPTVFMFDEPTAGMSVDEVPVVLDLIARLKQDASKTILLVEHKMDVVRSLADRIIVLHNGQLVADGEPAEVIASPIVQEAYLGVARGISRMSDRADA